jgi:sugar (pentulose or hexulose) kinase
VETDVRPQGLIVIDLGKTTSKAVLCAMDGSELVRRERPNSRCVAEGLAVLDTAGIEAWLGDTLRELGSCADVRAIVPVAHGAAAAIVRGGKLAAPPLDYEQPVPAEIRARYEAERDAFAATGSPPLPDGLNLGAQLFLLESLRPDLLDEGATILPWPQYWAWRLSGVMASEVSSLGCHTDLWRPLEKGPSQLARRRGWAARLAPLAPAGAVLGRLRDAGAARTGLPADAEILCGVHDSNAALLAARGLRELAGQEATVLSTGTWFVAMRSPAQGAKDVPLPEGRDCLLNVDVHGRPVPSARFMGGREIQILLEPDGLQLDAPELQEKIVRALPGIVADELMIAPSMVPGAGPFPRGRGGWVRRPEDPLQRAAAAAVYAALVADAALDLIGARERLLVEGRFARAEAFVRVLATLRPDMQVFTADGPLDLVFGACRLVDDRLRPPCGLRRVSPLELDVAAFRGRWRSGMEKELDEVLQ